MTAPPPIDRDELQRFFTTWKQTNPTDQSPTTVATAWRRYTSLPSPHPVDPTPSLTTFGAALEPLLATSSPHISTARILRLDGRRPPWTVTGLRLTPGQHVTTLAAGRLWRSRQLDLWLGPQFALWFRVGVAGEVFNGTGDTNTFVVRDGDRGELYVATQWPGQFGDGRGRVQGDLGVYEGVDGGFVLGVVVWGGEAEVDAGLGAMRAEGDVFGLVEQEVRRREGAWAVPDGWRHLWFLGVTDIFKEEEKEDGSCIRCRTRGNVGILQKELDLPLGTETMLSWDWVVRALPSSLREDTTISHDYLSVAVEFENGRDLTYTWSCELPVGHGYWCPLATWKDREFHVVVRSGTQELGNWLEEKRNVFRDYQTYISRHVPERIVRVWLIAGSRWQRLEGDMTVRNMVISDPDGSNTVI